MGQELSALTAGGEARPARKLRNRRLDDQRRRRAVRAALAAARRNERRYDKAARRAGARERPRLPPRENGATTAALPARVAPTVGAVRQRVVARRLSAKGLRAEPPAHRGSGTGRRPSSGRARDWKSVRERPFPGAVVGPAFERGARAI